MCYADEIILLSTTKKDLQRMICEVIHEFLEVGLEVGTDKCHWSSCPAKTKEKLKFGDDRIKWEPTLTFVGTILNLNGSDAAAMEHRIVQATKVFHKWKAVLTCKSVSLAKRIDLTGKTVFSAALWLSECWHLTERQQKRFNSWAARIVAQVAGIRRKTDEDMAVFWRRLFRSGHELLRSHGGSMNVRRRRRLHSFAGHLARVTDGTVHDGLRARSLAWCRHFQAHRLITHPKRFHPWRWESQLTTFYGEVPFLFVDEDVGWLARAQSRAKWKSDEESFASMSV